MYLPRRGVHDYDDFYDDDRAELLRERNQSRRYFAELMRHQSCQDPDHPGCANCEPEEEEMGMFF